MNRSSLEPTPPMSEAIDVSNYQFWFDHAEKLSVQEKHVEALACYNQSLDLRPAKAQVRIRPSDILARFHNDTETDSRDCQFWFDLAKQLFIQGNHLEVFSCYEKSLELDWQETKTRICQGGILTELECYADLNLKSYQFWFDHAEQLFIQGDYLEALVCYNQSSDLNPLNTQAWLRHGGILTHLDRYAEAVISFEAALALEPDNKIALLCKGFALHHIGEYEQAYMIYDRARGVKHSPLSARLRSWSQKLFKHFPF